MKDFLLLANVNVITYKEFFPLLKEGKARGGYTFNKVLMFETPEGEKSGPNIAWFTTLQTPNKKKLILTKKYKHTEYPHYDNYNAINVDKIKDIPYDYDCVMGVPITIFGYDLNNVEIISITENADYLKPLYTSGCKKYDRPYLNGERKYPRILIRRKQL